MAAISVLLLVAAASQTLGLPAANSWPSSVDESHLTARQGYFGVGPFDSHGGFVDHGSFYSGGQASGYVAQPARSNGGGYGQLAETVVRPPTQKVTRERQDGETTIERHLQRQIIHRQRQKDTRSEQTHRHDHHIEKLHKHVLHQVFNPHTVVTVNRNHHHHDRNELVTHVQDINQPIVHQYVRPSHEVRPGAFTRTKSEETIEEQKVLTPINKPVQVIRHPTQYRQHDYYH